jgi:tellurite resistance protein TehA-like permease
MPDKKVRYEPLYFLSSLGAGGITVAFWKLGDMTQQNWLTKTGQFIFLTLALLLFIINLPYWIKALRKNRKFFGIELPPSYHVRKRKPQSLDSTPPVISTGWLAMPVSLGMLLNASFASLPTLFGLNAQNLAPLGFWVWLLAYVIVFVFSFQILFNTFAATTKLEEFHFGLFLQPLAYGMIAVPGISIANMVAGPMGEYALLLGLTAFGVGGIIGSLALIFIVQRFFTYGLPDPSVAPTTLLLMPSITIYSIFVLRGFHYLAHHEVVVSPVFYKLVALMGIGFMGAAATLGLIVLYVYFRARVPFGPSWWSFVCPFVSLSVLSSVTYQFAELPIFLYTAVLALLVVTIIYLYVAGNTLQAIRKPRL